MTLLKTSILSLLATMMKLLAALVINKFVALYIGPSGLAFIGQFQNFVQLAMTAGQGAINTGITKYSAEYRDDYLRLRPLLSTGVIISCVSSISVGLIVSLFSKVLSLKIFGSFEYQYVFLLFGVSLIFFVLNTFLLAVLNGLKEIRAFVIVNVSQSMYSLIITSGLIFFYGLDGALIAFATNQAFAFMCLFGYLRKHPALNINKFIAGFNCEFAKKLGKYSLMAGVTAMTIPVSQMMVRDYLGSQFGSTQAGYWQGIWYISTMYLTLVTTTMSVYFLPRMSELDCPKTIKRELLNGYTLLIPAVLFLMFAIYSLRHVVIKLLFSAEFSSMEILFKWQLIGDGFKVASWLLGTLLLAKASVKLVVLSELFFALLFYVLTVTLSERFGLLGVTYAHASTYFCHLVFMYCALRLRKVI